ncbi:serine/threonine-protein kinase [Streptomyces violascens]|uniref:serine/threonine-protein kinase n=1 Tax=Streptomyces violascens TaxID=67381 RepID=UPI00378A25E3
MQHPNIVTIHDLGETGTGNQRVPFLVMELIGGDGLDAVLRRGAVTPADAARWGAQICDALADAHDAGIMHRDIKPSNVLITPSGIVKVLDFGVAKAADPYATAERLTQTGFIVGTPSYMAPEQARGFPEPRSDLYAVGCLLFELITGQLPFKAPDTVSYLSAHLTHEPPAPSSVSPGIPADWDDLVLTLLHKDPAQRYPNAAHLAQALRHLGGAADAAPPTVPTPRRLPTVAATAALPPDALGAPSGPWRPRTAPTYDPARGGGVPAATGPTTPHRSGGGTATAAIVLALLCLPGLLAMIVKFVEWLQRYDDAPTGLFIPNMAVAGAEAVLLAMGALRLSQHRSSGQRMIKRVGSVTVLHSLSATAQFLLSGGRLTMDAPPSVLVFVISPLTAAVAAAAVVTASQSATGRWCHDRS